MIKYKIQIDIDALSDIAEATKWYNKRQPGLGQRFQKIVKTQISTLKSNAHICTIRYKNVHCMPINKFPFMVHFRIDEVPRVVVVFAVIHTSQNPEIWEERNNPI